MASYVLLPWFAKLGPWGVWAVLPFELLHGVTFAIQWSAVTTHAGRVAPDGFHASAHQLINTIYFGLARGFGAAVGGRSGCRAAAKLLHRERRLAPADGLAAQDSAIDPRSVKRQPQRAVRGRDGHSIVVVGLVL